MKFDLIAILGSQLGLMGHFSSMRGPLGLGLEIRLAILLRSQVSLSIYGEEMYQSNQIRRISIIIPVPFLLLSFPCGVPAAYPLAVVVLHGLEPSDSCS
jgi:hypothetical protein